MKTLASLLIAVSFLTACNTFQGMGRDIESAGESLTGTAEKAQDEMNK